MSTTIFSVSFVVIMSADLKLSDFVNCAVADNIEPVVILFISPISECRAINSPYEHSEVININEAMLMLLVGVFLLIIMK